MWRLSLYKTAKTAGFDVNVVDDRESYANRERFPDAKEVIAEDFDQAMARITPNETSYIVIVTRGHHDDMRVLRWAVQTQARYIGMIGSKRKTITIFRELVKEGIAGTAFRARSCPGRTRHWRNHTRRNRGRDYRGIDRSQATSRAPSAAHELVSFTEDGRKRFG